MNYSKMENTTNCNMEKTGKEAPKNIEQKELETIIIASIKTIKWKRVKFGVDKAHKLVQDTLKENISLESVDKTLKLLFENLTLFRIRYVFPYQKIILV